MIDATDTLNFVISDGIQFLQSLTRHYGPEKGQEVWNAMGEAVGKEVRGKIFFKMIAGETGVQLRFNAGDAEMTGNAIPVIKCIRTYTGFGLKEAKDCWDKSKTQLVVLTTDSYEQTRLLGRELRQLGCNIL